MDCPNCQHENVPAAKFCSECGTRLRIACPRCGVEVLPTAKFCHECGVSLISPKAAAVPAEPGLPSPPPSLEQQFTAFQQTLPPSFREQLLARVAGENRLVTVLF